MGLTVAEQWRAEGEAKATRELLETALSARFGPLPAEIREALAEADVETMKGCHRLAITAPTLDDVGIVIKRKVEVGDWEALLLTLIEQLKAEGALIGCRQDLRLLLEERFGCLPEELAQQIERIDDLERLRAGLRQVLRAKPLAEFEL